MCRFHYNTKICLIAFSFLLLASPLYAISGNKYVVTRVIDGDTISIKAESFAGFPLRIETVRLIGLDAPELKQDPWGRRAKKHLKKLVSESNWVVNVEFDVQQRDRYGRLLGYIWNRQNKSLINEKMLEDGYAVLSVSQSNILYDARFAEADKKARAVKAGFWGPMGLEQLPDEWRKTHPEKCSAPR
jgi:micrococcal nuclease